MLQSFPDVQRRDETGDVLQGALQRLVKALRMVELNDRKHFLRLASLQIRRELWTLAEKIKNAPKEVPFTGDYSDDQGEADAPPDATTGPSDLALWTEFHEHAEQLAEPELEVFDLLYYQELSQHEAAEILGVSERTIRKRWGDARRTMVEKMGGRLPGL